MLSSETQQQNVIAVLLSNASTLTLAFDQLTLSSPRLDQTGNDPRVVADSTIRNKINLHFLVLVTLHKYGLHERVLLVSPRGGPVFFDQNIVNLCTNRQSDAYHEAADALLSNYKLMTLFQATHPLNSLNPSLVDALIIGDGLGYLEDLNRMEKMQSFLRRYLMKQRPLVAIGAGVTVLAGVDGGKYIANKYLTTWNESELDSMGLSQGRLRSTPEQLLKRAGAHLDPSPVVHKEKAWFGRDWKTVKQIIQSLCQDLYQQK